MSHSEPDRLEVAMHCGRSTREFYGINGGYSHSLPFGCLQTKSHGIRYERRLTKPFPLSGEVAIVARRIGNPLHCLA
ncbi:hypothetical protein KUCAC02_000482, partial [Chaenocephalus aceratus]